MLGTQVTMLPHNTGDLRVWTDGPVRTCMIHLIMSMSTTTTVTRTGTTTMMSITMTDTDTETTEMHHLHTMEQGCPEETDSTLEEADNCRDLTQLTPSEADLLLLIITILHLLPTIRTTISFVTMTMLMTTVYLHTPAETIIGRLNLVI